MTDEDKKWLERNGFAPQSGGSGTDFKKYVAGDVLVLFERSDGWHGIVSCMNEIFAADAKTAREAAQDIARQMMAKARKAQEKAGRLIAELGGMMQD